ncbi:MAG: low molecular weight protein-tyrosine-phosphatase [Weeksellaceae bacterium]|nr:low molecular weight protein-tyrosine-phosphatase [Weeksellaceae bacterium]
MRVLMVCLGNICRSPLAHGILQHKAKDSIFVDSAGTNGYHIGESPDPRSIAVAEKNNLDITTQRCRKFEVQDFDNFDIIFVMDGSNYRDILKMARNEEDEKKVKLIMNEHKPGMNLNVPDPYYGGDEGFDNVYKMLDQATDAFLKRIADEKTG